MAANKKLTELGEITDLAAEDLLYSVDYSSDTSYKITKFNALKSDKTTVTATIDINPTKSIYIVDTTAGHVDLAISVASKNLEGMRMIVKDTGNASTNRVKIYPTGGGTIDGIANYEINIDYGYVEIYCDGNELLIIGKS